MARDVTATRPAGEAVHRHQALLSAVERLVGVGGWERDLDSGEEIWTDGLYLILGRGREALLPSAEGFLACLHPEDRDGQRMLLARALAGSSPVQAELRIITPGGEERRVTSRVEVLRDVAGRPARLIGALADVTEARRPSEAEPPEAAEQPMRSIAHDFRNLLGVIVGNLELLLEQEALDPSARRLVDRAIRSARQGVELTRQLVAAQAPPPPAP